MSSTTEHSWTRTVGRIFRIVAIGVATVLVATSCAPPVEKEAVQDLADISSEVGATSEPISDYYPFTGNDIEIVVPDLATAVEITATGAQGGDSAGKATFGTITPGGAGTDVTARWNVQPGQKLTLRIGGAGHGSTPGWGGTSAGGGDAGCKNAGAGGGATVVELDGQLIAVAGGGGGGGFYGASAVTDGGGKGGARSIGQDGHGPKAGHGGAVGADGVLTAGGAGGNGKNLGGCAGGGGGGWSGGSGGTGGSTGGGGGGGGGAGGSYTTGNIDRTVYSTAANSRDGHVLLTFTPQNHN